MDAPLPAATLNQLSVITLPTPEEINERYKNSDMGDLHIIRMKEGNIESGIKSTNVLRHLYTTQIVPMVVDRALQLGRFPKRYLTSEDRELDTLKGEIETRKTLIAMGRDVQSVVGSTVDLGESTRSKSDIIQVLRHLESQIEIAMEVAGYSNDSQGAYRSIDVGDHQILPTRENWGRVTVSSDDDWEKEKAFLDANEEESERIREKIVRDLSALENDQDDHFGFCAGNVQHYMDDDADQIDMTPDEYIEKMRKIGEGLKDCKPFLGMVAHMKLRTNGNKVEINAHRHPNESGLPLVSADIQDTTFTVHPMLTAEETVEALKQFAIEWVKEKYGV